MRARLMPWIGGISVAFAVLAAAFAASRESDAQDLVADLSRHLVAITTGFVGTDVVLFGAIENAGDVAVVVRGPDEDVVVRRKKRVLGLWMNLEGERFANVPSFYYIVSTRPLADILAPAIRAREGIGVDRLAQESQGPAQNAGSRIGPEVEPFRAALRRNRERLGLFAEREGGIDFLGGRLFRTTVNLPANVPTGTYTVQVFLIRDGEIAGAQSTPLIVSKIGLEAWLYRFAHRQSLLYGLLAAAIAAMAGWLSGAVFRRLQT